MDDEQCPEPIPIKPAPNQLTFQARWDKIEKDLDARHKLISEVPASREVRALLHALDAFDCRKVGTDSFVSASIREIGDRLGWVENTTKKYIKRAKATPYLEVLTSDHTMHTYVIHWLAILNRETDQTNEQAADRTVRRASDAQAADRTGNEDARGSIRRSGTGNAHPPRGSNPTPEGVNFVILGGQKGGQKSPTPPSENLLLQDKVSNNLLPTSSPSSGEARRAHRGTHQRGEFRRKSMCGAFWPAWEKAIRSRDLRNPEHVLELYLFAVQLGLFRDSEVNRFHVFCQAAKNERMHLEGHLKTRQGLFASNVANSRWHADLHDEDKAREMMKRSDVHMRLREDAPIEDKVAAVQEELDRRRELRTEAAAEVASLAQRFGNISGS